MAQLASNCRADDSSSFLGLVADGPTDQRILERMAKTCAEVSGAMRAPSKVESLRGVALRDDLDRYWRATQSADSAATLRGRAAFVEGSFKVLESAIFKFEKLIGKPLSCRDRVILATDAERKLAHKDRYFEEWAWVVPRLLEQAIEKWYHYRIGHGYARADLPVVLPVVFFPSIDVLVAAAKATAKDAFDPRGLRPDELKRRLYGTDDLRSVASDRFGEMGLNCITPEGIENIWKKVPEVRLFLLRLLAC